MPRILVVEDSQTQAEELRLLLESEGYDVESAPDGEAAYQTLDTGDFDLVLSDVQMPKVSGYELCRRIKDSPERRDLPVLLLTVHNDPKQVMQGLECGADLFISKPYHVEDLVTAIQGVLAAHSSQSERPFRMGDGVQVSFLGRTYTIGEDKDKALEYLVSMLEDFVRGKDRELQTKLRAERDWGLKRAEAMTDELQRVGEILATKIDVLRGSEHRMQAALNALPVCAAILDGVGTILWLNERWIRFVDTLPLLGSAGFEGRNYPDSCDKVGGSATPAAQVLAAGVREVLSGHRDSYYLEYRALAEDGESEAWYCVRVHRLEDAGDAAVVVVHEEISRLKLLQQALQRQTSELAVSEVDRRLMAGLCHHLNNNLCSILGYAGLLAMDIKPGHPLWDDLDPIRVAAKRLAGLTYQALVYTRQDPARPEKLEVNTLVENLELLIRSTAGDGVEVALQLAPDLEPARADRAHVQMAVLELVRNAKEAMPAGGKLTIQTLNVDLPEGDGPLFRDAIPGAYVSLAVSDTGHGMSREVLERVMEPFFTTRSEEDHFGMGLAAVYAAIRAMGGHVAVESTPERGTTVSLLLPAYLSGTDPGTPNGHGEERLPGSKAPDGTARGAPPVQAAVLVVEDRENLRELIARILELHGYKVLEASSAEEALDTFDKVGGKVDLLLTDVRMSGATGMSLAGELRELKPGLKVLFASGYLEDARDLSDAWRGTPLLRKPFEEEDLLVAVREALR